MSDILDLFGVGDEQIPPEPTPAPTPPEPAPAVEVAATSPVGPDLRMLDCGHTNWSGASAHEEARAAGFCCEGGRKKMSVSWRDLRGPYVRPIPAHARRTVDKDRGPGFPGLCSDHEGYYIGGVVNDCRMGSPDGRRCLVHGGVPPVVEPVEPEPTETVEPEPVAVQVKSSPNPPLPPAGASWKQRQLSAKRDKR